MAKTLNPGTEKVGVRFIRAITGINNVATALPEDSKSWGMEGFVQVQSIGGTPHVDLPQQQSVVTISCWAAAVNSGKAPWGQSEELAEQVRQAITANPLFFQTTYDMGTSYKDVKVLSAWPVSEPRRVEGNTSSYAEYNFDVQINWVVVS